VVSASRAGRDLAPKIAAFSSHCMARFKVYIPDPMTELLNLISSLFYRPRMKLGDFLLLLFFLNC
jgi:hypothetical protein